jgi:hypothetical protein
MIKGNKKNEMPVGKLLLLGAGMLFTPAVTIVSAVLFKHLRVGDGSEYIAMYLAWKETGRPFLSSVVAQHYEELRQSQAILGMVPFSWFGENFPALKLGDTQDVNHFWFYSLLAAPIGKIGSAIGLFRDPTYAFALLHALLALIVNIIATRLFGVAGLLTATLLLVASPCLWFVDKIHTEFFTVATTLIAVFALLGRRLTWVVLTLAVASTQNLSYALPAAVTGIIWLINPSPLRATRVDVALVAMASIIVLLHPFYYFSRYGGITPQVIGYGAEFSSGALFNSRIWFIDPDVGLIPHWPMAVVILILGSIAWAKRPSFPGGIQAYAIMALIFVTNFVVQSATINLNAGGTIDIARYALWYLPLFVPFSVALLERAVASSAKNLSHWQTSSG